MTPRSGHAAESQSSGAPTSGQSVNLGIASYTFRNFGLEPMLAMTRRAGLKYICLKSFHLPLDAKPDRIADTAKKIAGAGLTLYAVGVITMHNETEVTKAFDYAKAVGAGMIVAAPSVATLPLIEKKAKQYDIRVAIHNHGPGDQHFPTPASVYEKIESLDRRIGLCIDIGHTTRVGANLIESVEKYADRLLDMHIKDVSAAKPTAHETQVGRGVIDIPRLLRTLAQIKYAGVLSFEYENEPNDPLPGLAESVGYVRGVTAAIRPM